MPDKVNARFTNTIQDFLMMVFFYVNKSRLYQQLLSFANVYNSPSTKSSVQARTDNSLDRFLSVKMDYIRL